MSTVQTTGTDVVNAILGIDGTSPIAQLRNQKPELAEQLQAYYDALFNPTEASSAEFPTQDRFLIAARIASHTDSTAVAEWYAAKAICSGIPAETIARARDVAATWPDQTTLGASVRHADLVTLTPSETSQESLQRLKDSGLTPAGILSLAQVIAFVSYQLRLIAGLRAFGDQS